MFTAEILLAAALLTNPKAEAKMSEATVLRSSILALAADAEVLDTREKGFVMGQDTLGDLTMLQGRYEESLDAPLLAECERFHDRKWVSEALAINRYHRNYCMQRLAIDLIHSEEIHLIVQGLDSRYEVWDAVRDARCDYYYITIRRASLKLLRTRLGCEDFYMGKMPNILP